MASVKESKKQIRKTFKVLTKKENIWKALVVVSSLALLSTSILPYLIR